MFVIMRLRDKRNKDHEDQYLSEIGVNGIYTTHDQLSALKFASKSVAEAVIAVAYVDGMHSGRHNNEWLRYACVVPVDPN